MSTPHGRTIARRTVIEIDVLLINAPALWSSVIGDRMHPHRVTLRFHMRGDGTAGDLRYPITVTGPPVAATTVCPDSRHVTFPTAGLTPRWMTIIAQWARGQVIA